MSRIAVLCGGLLLALPFAAEAAEPNPLSADSYWTVTVRAKAGEAPAYPGASSYKLFALPSASVRRAGTPVAFAAPDDSISYALYDGGWLKAGPAGTFSSGRDAGGHPELKGLRNIDWTIEAGAFAEAWLTPKFRTRVEVLRSFHGHEGVQARLAADWVERTGAWTLALGPRLVLGNNHYVSAYFSVRPEEALANGVLPAYRAKGGLQSVGVAGSATYQISKQWAVTGYGRYDRLSGDAGKSPIATKAGSRNQLTFGAALAYSFDVKQFW